MADRTGGNPDKDLASARRSEVHLLDRHRLPELPANSRLQGLFLLYVALRRCPV
jgi:hypothetical protein